MARIKPRTNLRAGRSSVAGAGHGIVSGSGALVPAAASLAGVGERVIGGSGALAAQAAVLVGSSQGGDPIADADLTTLTLTAAEGSRARLLREGMTFEADTAIMFDESSGRLRGVGNATFTPPEGEPVESPSMVFDVDEARGFAVAGEDRKFVAAQARVVGKDKVEVWADSVPNPVAVRYAWADNPVCNLYSREGLPVTPFRSDDWPGVTAGKEE